VEQRLNGKDLNCLINNAGTAAKLRFSDINEKDMMETYRQNVIGPWKVTKVYISVALLFFEMF
jgi:short-subunit dehydrogenase